MGELFVFVFIVGAIVSAFWWPRVGGALGAWLARAWHRGQSRD